VDPHYVTGLAEGQGSFTYSRSGRQLAVYFALKLDAEDRVILEQLQDFFEGAGTIYDSGAKAYYRVTHREDLKAIVAHFDQFPLQTKKARSYGIWRSMVLAKQAFRTPDRELLENLAMALSNARS
jgi:LAGLIDADG DNA endonuclease family protein